MNKKLIFFICVISGVAFSVFENKCISSVDQIGKSLIAYWNEDLLKHDESQIEEFIQKLDSELRNCPGLTPEDFCNVVSEKLDEKIAFYKEHIDRIQYRYLIMEGLALVAITLIGAKIQYDCYCHWHKPIRDQIAQYYAKYNITERRFIDTKYIGGAGEETQKLVDLLNLNESYWNDEYKGLTLLTVVPLFGGIYISSQINILQQSQLHYEKLNLFKKVFKNHNWLT